MKKIIMLFCIIAFCWCCNDTIDIETKDQILNTEYVDSVHNNYYWYNGSKVYFKGFSDTHFTIFDGGDSVNLSRASSSTSLNEYLGETLYSDGAQFVISDVSKSRLLSTSVAYDIPFAIGDNGDEIGLNHIFYVKLRKISDYPELEKFAALNNVEIIEFNEFRPNWYTLICSNKSAGNSVEMANKFYESGKFEYAHPDIMDVSLCSVNSINDPLYTEQWNLNSGNSQIDIDIEKAWEITTGDEDVIVAVIDQGINRNHPDLTNLHPLKYDVLPNPLDTLYGTHGMMCAGVIGATINNSIGIAGIAPGCRIMDVRYPLGHSDVLGVSGKLSNCIDWAWNNGAWVISNSWSNGATDLVREAIDDAIDKGRNGLGCVVVFASGNNNLSSIPQPNAHNSDALVVGASNSLGHRIGLGEWNNGKNQTQASNYGTKLDVMAPGINIQTTNVTASSGELYVGEFEGTSAACPHAAGVAALVLSFKPYLTQHEVVDIIEMTATKMSGYTYTNTSGRTNGTWNVYTGYGLLNAYNALLLAEQYNSYLYTYLYNKVYSSNLLFSTDEMVYTGNIVVNNNASVNIQAEDGFIINQDLVVNTGCSLLLCNN